MTMTVSLSLRVAREAAGLTQVELAKKVGVRQATISDMERGASKRIDFDLLDKLCDVLKTTPGQLFDYEPKKGKGKR